MKGWVIVTLSHSENEYHPGRCVTSVYGPFPTKQAALEFTEHWLMDWEDPHYMTIQDPSVFDPPAETKSNDIQSPS